MEHRILEPIPCSSNSDDNSNSITHYSYDENNHKSAGKKALKNAKKNKNKRVFFKKSQMSHIDNYSTILISSPQQTSTPGPSSRTWTLLPQIWHR